MKKQFYLFGVIIGLCSVTIPSQGADYMGIEIPEDLNGMTYFLDLNSMSATPIVDERDKPCVQPGPMCENCTFSTICVEQSGGYIKFTRECETGTQCLDKTGLCSKDPNPHCDDFDQDYHFICHQEGVFPNPFNCKEYHICLNRTDSREFEDDKLKCPDGFYFDTNSTLCTKKLINNTCPSPGNICNGIEGITFPIEGNQRLYYMCMMDAELKKPTPQVFVCKNNYVYNIYTRKCENPVPKSKVDSTNRCKELGKFFDPNCQYYRQCNRLESTPSRLNCGSGKYYDHNSEQCVSYTCRNVADILN